MSKQPNLSENDLFKMNSSTNDPNKKPESSKGNASDIDSLRDFMRASSVKGVEKKESVQNTAYQPVIYKKPIQEDNATTPPPTPKPNPVIDYRKNVQRQAREQKKVGSALSFLVYAVLGVLLIFGALAGYGAYVIFGELRSQKATAQQIQNELTGQIETLQSNLAQTQAALEQQSKQANEVIVELQGKLEIQQNTFQANLATEKKNRETALNARDNQIYELRQRVRRLENRYSNY